MYFILVDTLETFYKLKMAGRMEGLRDRKSDFYIDTNSPLPKNNVCSPERHKESHDVTERQMKSHEVSCDRMGLKGVSKVFKLVSY